VVFSNGYDWTETRRMAVKTFKDLGVGRDLMEEMTLESAKEMIDDMRKADGQPMKIRELINWTILSALWSLMTGEKMDEELFNRLFDNLQKVFRKYLMKVTMSIACQYCT